MTGKYEAELNRIRAMEDWRIPKAGVLRSALESLHGAISTVMASAAWEGQTTDAVNLALSDIQEQIRTISDSVQSIDSAVTQANNARRAASDAELPSATVDPFWANAAKGASVVVHPLLGPIAAEKALDVIGDFLGNRREAEAERVVKSIEQSLVPPGDSVAQSTATLQRVNYRNLDGEEKRDDDGSGGGGSAGGGQPIGYRHGGTGSSSVPGSGYQSSVTGVLVGPAYPNGTGGTGGIDPTGPGGPGGTGGSGGPGGAGGPGGSGGPGSGTPSVDFPGGGVLPGGPGGAGGGYPYGPVGTGGGALPGGLPPAGAGGGSGIGGLVGGGAGATAIAAGSKIAGAGGLGGLSGAGGIAGVSGGGAGSASGAGLRAGGLLGSTAPVGGGASGVGGTGGAAGNGTGAGSGSAGARPGMAMMGGQGAGAESEREKRSGLGGPIAPKLEDEDGFRPRAKGARAGSRDNPSS